MVFSTIMEINRQRVIGRCERRGDFSHGDVTCDSSISRMGRDKESLTSTILSFYQ